MDAKLELRTGQLPWVHDHVFVRESRWKLREVTSAQGGGEGQRSFTVKNWRAETFVDYKSHEYTLDEEGILWCWPDMLAAKPQGGKEGT